MPHHDYVDIEVEDLDDIPCLDDEEALTPLVILRTLGRVDAAAHVVLECGGDPPTRRAFSREWLLGHSNLVRTLLDDSPGGVGDGGDGSTPLVVQLPRVPSEALELIAYYCCAVTAAAEEFEIRKPVASDLDFYLPDAIEEFVRIHIYRSKMRKSRNADAPWQLRLYALFKAAAFVQMPQLLDLCAALIARHRPHFDLTGAATAAYAAQLLSHLPVELMLRVAEYAPYFFSREAMSHLIDAVANNPAAQGALATTDCFWDMSHPFGGLSDRGWFLGETSQWELFALRLQHCPDQPLDLWWDFYRAKSIPEPALQALAPTRVLRLVRDAHVLTDGIVLPLVSALHDLVKLEIYTLDGLKEPEVVMRQLARAPNIRELKLSRAALSDACFSAIAAMPSLTSLTLCFAALRFEVLEHIGLARGLEQLQLWRCYRIADASFLPLASLPALRQLVLNFEEGSFGDADFRALSRCNSDTLEELSVNHVDSASFTVSSVLRLRALRRLKRLNLSMSVVSASRLNDAELAELRAAMPKGCEVTYQ